MTELCQRVKAKDCTGSIIDQGVNPEDWVYWCKVSANGWTLNKCNCSGPKYLMIQNWDDVSKPTYIEISWESL